MPHYAFIVGVNQDWPEQRTSLGDIGLARALSRRCRLPRERLAEVYDAGATRSAVLRALERLLDRRNEDAARRDRDGSGAEGADTLLFYYGGHGKREQFCTQTQTVRRGKIRKEPWLEHSEVIDLLERKFKGGTAVCIIDCCHSGGFGEAVVRKQNDAKKALNVNYGCVMSVPPADEAGLEWSMTECLIRAFKGGDLLVSRREDDGRNSRCYYLSTKDGFLYTKDGKHPIDRSRLLVPDSTDSTRDTARHPTWRQVIEYLADEYGRVKGDRLTTLFRGKGMEDGSFLKKPCTFGDDATRDVSSSPTARIPRDNSWMQPFLRKSHAVGDWVYVKRTGENASGDHVGGGVHVMAPRIGWFPGRMISINSVHDSYAKAITDSDEGNATPKHYTARIELHDDISKDRWTITMPLDPSPSSSRNAVLGGLPFSFKLGFDPLRCIDVIARLARKLAYLDTTLPPNAHVKAPWPEDGKYYKGKTLCRTEIPWEEVDLDSLEIAGPCVALRWKDDDSVSFVPTAACIVKDAKPGKGSSPKPKKKVTLAERSAMVAVGEISNPMDAMMASFACEGKKLYGGTPVPDGSVDEGGADSLEAYDAEDSKWSPVQLMNGLDPSLLPLQVLAYHACYRESGNFSLVYWESDSTISLVPDGYLRRRRTTEKDGDEDDSEEESSVGAEERDVRKYVDEVGRYRDEGSAEDPASPTLKNPLELSSLAVVCLGLGFVLGSRSKR